MPTLNGYAALFDSISEDLGKFREILDPHCFDRVLASDVRALLNHDASRILGRTKSGTLRLTTDARGLRCAIDLPSNSLGADVLESVRRGDLSQMSFAFSIAPNGERWDLKGEQLVRTVLEVRVLQDVSIVSFPAYSATSISTASSAGARGMSEAEQAQMARNRRRLGAHGLGGDVERQAARNRRRLHEARY